MKKGYLDIDISVDERVFEQVEEVEQSFTEDGLRPERYTVSFLIRAEEPSDIPRRAMQGNVWMGVEGQNPDLDESEYPDTAQSQNEEYEIDDIETVADILDTLEASSAKTASQTYEWSSNDVIPVLNNFTLYEEILRQGSQRHRTPSTERVVYLATGTAEGEDMTQALGRLESRGRIGLRLDEENDQTFLMYEEAGPNTGYFQEVDGLNNQKSSLL